MNSNISIINLIEDRIFQISEGKNSLKDLNIIENSLKSPNLFLSTKLNLKILVILGYLNLDNIDKALKYVNELLVEVNADGLESIKISKNVEYFIDCIGKKLLNLNQYDYALKIFRLALDQAKLESNTNVIARISKHLAYAYYYLGEYDKASRLLEISSSITNETNESFNCLRFAAKLRYKIKDYLKTITLLENALKVSKKIENKDNIIEIQKKLIDIKREVLIKDILNDEEKIFAYMEQITQTLKNLGFDDELCSAYYECGIILEKKGYLDEAILYYEESSRISYEKGIWSIYGRVSLQLGLISLNQNDLEIAKSYCEQVIQIGEYLEDSELEKFGKKLKNTIENLKQIKGIEGKKSETSISTEITSSLSSKDSQSITDSSLSLKNAELPISKINEQINQSSVGRESSFIPQQHEPLSEYSNMESSSKEQDLIKNKSSNHGLPANKTIKDTKGVNELRSFDTIRAEIAQYLIENGFIVEFDITPYNGTSSIDIVASKGSIRKKKMYIMISNNEGEASLAGYLFNSMSQSGRKIIFLEAGNPRNVSISSDITLVTDTAQIPAI
ncbi:MAG: tetratricopeptide repeat protein [Candidatus Thorarchaeota archaeon]